MYKGTRTHTQRDTKTPGEWGARAGVAAHNRRAPRWLGRGSAETARPGWWGHRPLAAPSTDMTNTTPRAHMSGPPPPCSKGRGHRRTAEEGRGHIQHRLGNVDRRVRAQGALKHVVRSPASPPSPHADQTTAGRRVCSGWGRGRTTGPCRVHSQNRAWTLAQSAAGGSTPPRPAPPPPRPPVSMQSPPSGWL
jgi:hypothetical protein